MGSYIRLFFSILVTVLFLIGMIMIVEKVNSNSENEKIYFKYTVGINAPNEYNLLFGGHNSYFYRQEIDSQTGQKVDRRVTSFPTLGDFMGGYWRSSGTVTSQLNEGEFPTGVYLKWYSLFEKQGWEVRYELPVDLISQLKSHKFINLHEGDLSKVITRYKGFSFDLYAMPKGLVYLYISGGGETYLLGEIQAKPVDINFDIYRKTLHSKRDETAEDVFNRRLSYQTEEFQEAYHNGTLSFSTEKWERRMKRYNWEVVGNNLYKVKGPYNGVYTNAEMYNIYEDGKNTFRDQHAPPNHLTVYLEGTELSPNPGRVERVRFRFDDDEIMEAFEKVEAVNPEGKIKLEVVMSSDFKTYRILLTNGTRGVRLKPTMFYIEDIPHLYKPTIESPNYKMPSVD